ncbi:MAG: NUDIX hydrolase [Acholeplasmataceae bacterium]
MKKEVKQGRKIIFEGRVFTVFLDDVLNHQSKPATREVLKHNGGVAVIATEGDCVYLIKQFRYAIDQDLIEVPAGKLEKDEHILLAAKRELKEETGLTADTWTYLGPMHPTPGYSTEVIHLYHAQDLKQGLTEFDPDESIETIKIPLKTALQMIETQDITDSKTIICLYRIAMSRKDL